MRSSGNVCCLKTHMPSLVFSYRCSTFQLKRETVNENFMNMSSFSALFFNAFSLLSEELSWNLIFNWHPSVANYSQYTRTKGKFLKQNKRGFYLVFLFSCLQVILHHLPTIFENHKSRLCSWTLQLNAAFCS